MTDWPELPFKWKLGFSVEASAAGAVVIAPIDKIKTRLQLSQGDVFSEKKSVTNIVRSIYHKEGARMFYHGARPLVVGVMIEKTFKVCAIDILTRLVQKNDPRLTAYHSLLIGTGVGLVQVSIATPAEAIKIMFQQLEDANSKQSASNLIRKHGWKHLITRGMAPCLVRDIPFNILFIGLGAKIKYWYEDRYGSEPSVYLRVLINGVSAALAAFVGTPADVVKSNLQMQNSPYNSFAGALRGVYKTSGWKGFVNTAPIRIATIAPVYATIFFIYDLMNWLYYTKLELPPKK